MACSCSGAMNMSPVWWTEESSEAEEPPRVEWVAEEWEEPSMAPPPSDSPRRVLGSDSLYGREGGRGGEGGREGGEGEGGEGGGEGGREESPDNAGIQTFPYFGIWEIPIMVVIITGALLYF